MSPGIGIINCGMEKLSLEWGGMEKLSLEWGCYGNSTSFELEKDQLWNRLECGISGISASELN
jgi:hypothetical protein